MEVLGESLSLVTSYITNPTWANVGSNMGIPGERRASESWRGLTSDSVHAVQMV